MPRVRNNWEAEYTDPISEKEDRKAKEAEDKENEEIMRDIIGCYVDLLLDPSDDELPEPYFTHHFEDQLEIDRLFDDDDYAPYLNEEW